MRTSAQRKNVFVFSVVTLLISGCSVTPSKLDDSSVKHSVQANLELINNDAELALLEVDLAYAVGRAVQFNYERKLKTLESVLQDKQLEMSVFEQLPSMTASAGYSKRDSYAASASTTFLNGVPADLPATPSYSVSQDKDSTTSSVGFAWSVLDFGLSYVRAKQQADQYLIAQERERKVIHNITKEVRSAYYRAVSAQKLLSRIEPLMVRARDALASSEELEALRAEPPLEALAYQRSLLEILRTLQSLRQELSTSKSELARLMGIKPGTELNLTELKSDDYQVPEVSLGMSCMETIALERRPELMETRYRERISVEETRAALLKLLPGITLDAGYNYDGSDYLLNNEWASYGAKVSWNLFNIFSLGKQQELADLKVALAKQQTLATSMAVLSQVHMANANYAESRTTYRISEQYLSVSQRIADQTDNASQVQNVGELKLIREHLNQILAELRRDIAFASMQNYYGEIMTSIGLDLIDDEYKSMDVEAVAELIKARLEQWNVSNFDSLSCETI